MKKIIRLTENELEGILYNTVNKVINESRADNEIKLAQKELVKMGTSLSGVGMRLEGTPYEIQFQRIYDEIVKLNNALINQIKGGK